MDQVKFTKPEGAKTEITPMAEIDAMAAIANALVGFDRASTYRVLEWAVSKYLDKEIGSGY